jgi:hypothetical protein
VYRIIDNHATGAGRVAKYGKGSALTASGGSRRAQAQVNRWNRIDPGRYSYSIISHHAGTRAARSMETRLINGYLRKFNARPARNKVSW